MGFFIRTFPIFCFLPLHCRPLWVFSCFPQSQLIFIHFHLLLLVWACFSDFPLCYLRRSLPLLRMTLKKNWTSCYSSMGGNLQYLPFITTKSRTNFKRRIWHWKTSYQQKFLPLLKSLSQLRGNCTTSSHSKTWAFVFQDQILNIQFPISSECSFVTSVIFGN